MCIRDSVQADGDRDLGADDDGGINFGIDRRQQFNVILKETRDFLRPIERLDQQHVLPQRT